MTERRPGGGSWQPSPSSPTPRRRGLCTDRKRSSYQSRHGADKPVPGDEQPRHSTTMCTAGRRHTLVSTEIAVDIWCSSSRASSTSLSAIFPASTQTMPRHAGLPRSAMAAAFSAQGFQTTVEAAPFFSMATWRPHPRSSMTHRA